MKNDGTFLSATLKNFTDFKKLKTDTQSMALNQQQQQLKQPPGAPNFLKPIG